MDTHRSTARGFSPVDRRRLATALAAARGARVYRRLQALHDVAAGEAIAMVARRLQVERSTVHRWIERYQREGSPQSMADRARSGRPRLASGLTDAKLRQLLGRDPRRAGFDANTWTVPLLAAHLRAQQIPISARTLRRRMRAARLRWKRPRYVFVERADHVGAKKGGSFGG